MVTHDVGPAARAAEINPIVEEVLGVTASHNWLCHPVQQAARAQLVAHMIGCQSAGTGSPRPHLHRDWVHIGACRSTASSVAMAPWRFAPF